MKDPVFVVGAQRCGTTRLHRSLSAHPELVVARPARPEPRYFLRDDAVVGDPSGWLDHCFGGVDTLRGRVPVEKSTSYIESDLAAERIASTFPRAHVVVLLRDPVERAVSNYAFSVANGVEDRPPADALLGASPPWDRARFSVDPRDYRGRSRYGDHLPRWRFAGDRLHVLLFEEFVASPAPLAGLYGALGVDPSHLPDDWDVPVNAAPGAPDVDAAVRAELAARLAPSVRRLEAQLGRDLAVWPSSSG